MTITDKSEKTENAFVLPTGEGMPNSLTREGEISDAVEDAAIMAHEALIVCESLRSNFDFGGKEHIIKLGLKGKAAAEFARMYNRSDYATYILASVIRRLADELDKLRFGEDLYLYRDDDEPFLAEKDSPEKTDGKKGIEDGTKGENKNGKVLCGCVYKSF